MAVKYKHPANSRAGRYERVQAAYKRKSAQEKRRYTTRSSSSSRSKSKSGCYVATCVYDSYDCPQVWTLRRYRDQKLAQTAIGRLFIRCYYAVSQIIVKLFGRTKYFRKFGKLWLDKIVRKLNAQGFCSERYQDRV